MSSRPGIDARSCAEQASIGSRTNSPTNVKRRLVHPDNNSTSVLILFEDVTDRRQGDAQKDILLAETRHRMKNLLAIVRSLANQADVEGRSAKEYRDAFLGRFQAVAEAETLALAAGSAEADLSALVDQVLKSAGPERYRVIAGRDVRLKPRQTVPMSLILHELVTNAWKYGALSSPEGLVHLSWRTSEEQESVRLHIDWREENGPPVTPPLAPASAPS